MELVSLIFNISAPDIVDYFLLTAAYWVQVGFPATTKIPTSDNESTRVGLRLCRSGSDLARRAIPRFESILYPKAWVGHGPRLHSNG